MDDILCGGGLIVRHHLGCCDRDVVAQLRMHPGGLPVFLMTGFARVGLLHTKAPLPWGR